MEQLISLASQFGAIGLVTLAAGWYVFKRDMHHDEVLKEMRDMHKQERVEMMGTISRQHSEAMTTQKETSSVLQKLTVAVTELSTLFRDRK